MLGPLRDVSLIILLFPMCLCLLAPLALMGGMVYLTRRGRLALPDKLHRAHGFMRRVDEAVDKAGEKIAAPFIAADAQAGRARAQWNFIKRTFSKEQANDERTTSKSS